MSDRDEYFNYVVNVLGVKSLYLDAHAQQYHTTTIPLLVQVEGFSSYNNEEKELLEKMIAALKLDLNNVKVVELETETSLTYNFLVVFKDHLNTELSNQPNSVVTHSPRTLVKQTTLKKQVWGELQKVIQFFES